MKRILVPILLLVLLFPALAMGQTIYGLVVTNGLYYKKFTDVSFTGKITEQKIQGALIEGRKVGSWVYYYKNGQLQYEGTYKDGKEDGLWVYYRENGQLWSKDTYKDGKKDGPWVSYNRDGTVNERFTVTY